MKKLFSLIISIVLLLSLCSCGAGEVAEESTNNKLKIVATIFPQYDFARAIAGDKAQVKMLITPGTESHSFEPTTSDIKAIQNCDIFIYTGGESDHWIDSLLENIENKDIKILSLMDIIEPHSHEVKLSTSTATKTTATPMSTSGHRQKMQLKSQRQSVMKCASQILKIRSFIKITFQPTQTSSPLLTKTLQTQ